MPGWRARLAPAHRRVHADLVQDLAGVPDERLLQVCVAEERVLVTLDLDVANPLRFEPQKTSGIAVLRVPTLPGRSDLEDAARVLINQLVSNDIAGQLWVVTQGRVRQYEPGSRNGPVIGAVNEEQS